jgi:hypothetical protein
VSRRNLLIFCAAAFWIFATGCVSPQMYDVAKCVAPEIPSWKPFKYNYDVKVDSLQPVLKWEGLNAKPGMTWELCIWGPKGRATTGSMVHFQTTWGTPVYNRTGITGNSHRVEEPLDEDTMYFWSIRSVTEGKVSAWASVSVTAFTPGMISSSHRIFYFKTPSTN